LLRALRFLGEVDFVMRTALQTMFYYAILLLLAQFVFGVLATNLFWDLDDDNYSSLFSCLGNSMWTLFCLMTLDGWVSIVNGILIERPLMQPFFILFIFFSVSAVSVIPTIFIEVQMSAREAAKQKALLEMEVLPILPLSAVQLTALRAATDPQNKNGLVTENNYGKVASRSNSLPSGSRQREPSAIKMPQLPLLTSDEDPDPLFPQTVPARKASKSKASLLKKESKSGNDNDRDTLKEIERLRNDIENAKHILLKAVAEQGQAMSLQIQALTLQISRSQHLESFPEHVESSLDRDAQIKSLESTRPVHAQFVSPSRRPPLPSGVSASLNFNSSSKQTHLLAQASSEPMHTEFTTTHVNVPVTSPTAVSGTALDVMPLVCPDAMQLPSRSSALLGPADSCRGLPHKGRSPFVSEHGSSKNSGIESQEPLCVDYVHSPTKQYLSKPDLQSAFAKELDLKAHRGRSSPKADDALQQPDQRPCPEAPRAFSATQRSNVADRSAPNEVSTRGLAVGRSFSHDSPGKLKLVHD
jgi:hypothetical protein